jgi:hypothetical protein
MRCEVASDAAFDEFGSDDVVLVRVLVSLEHHTICHRLEKVLPKQRLRLRWLPKGVRLFTVARNEFTFPWPHIIDDYDSDLVLISHLHQPLQHLANDSFTLTVTYLTAS